MFVRPHSVTLALCMLAPNLATAQWLNPPTEQQLQETPGLVHESFESNAMSTTVGYSVVLPPSYDDGDKRYPVVYWLHGGSGNESSSLYTSRAWRELVEARTIRETIVVYPNGFRSGYMDHHDGKTMVETMIIRELIPRIDERYRTVASASGRAVHGFSMGASGALKFAIKYPDLFCAAVAYGGGAIDLENDRSAFILKILERNLKSDPALIRQNNTYFYLGRHHARVRENGVRFLLICGGADDWKQSALDFHAALRKHNISSELVIVPGIDHEPRALTEAAGKRASIFQDSAFRAANPGRHTATTPPAR